MVNPHSPWHYDGRRWIRDANGTGVLRIQIGANPEHARCAAAGPVLLAAAREALRWIEAKEEAKPTLSGPLVMNDLRAAIAAAEPLPQGNPMPAEWLPPTEDEATLDAREHANERSAWMAEQEAELRSVEEEG